jgi:hypothetical protein
MTTRTYLTLVSSTGSRIALFADRAQQIAAYTGDTIETSTLDDICTALSDYDRVATDRGW